MCQLYFEIESFGSQLEYLIILEKYDDESSSFETKRFRYQQLKQLVQKLIYQDLEWSTWKIHPWSRIKI